MNPTTSSMNMGLPPISDTNCLVCATTVGFGSTRNRKRTTTTDNQRTAVNKRVKYLTLEEMDKNCTSSRSSSPTDPSAKSRLLDRRREACTTKGSGMDVYKCHVRVPTVITIPEALQCVFKVEIEQYLSDLNSGLALCEGCAKIVTELYKLHKKLDQLTSDLSFLASILRMDDTSNGTRTNNAKQKNKQPELATPVEKMSLRSGESEFSTTPSQGLRHSEFNPTTVQLFEVSQGEDVLNVMEYVTDQIKVEQEDAFEEDMQMETAESDPEFVLGDHNHTVESSDESESVALAKTHKNARPQLRRSERSRTIVSKLDSVRKPRAFGGSNSHLSFTCSICAKPYAHSANAREHILKHFGPEEEHHGRTLKCDRCRQVFLGEESFNKHSCEAHHKRRRSTKQPNRPKAPEVKYGVGPCHDCNHGVGGNSSKGSIFEGQQIPIECGFHKKHRNLVCETCGRTSRDKRSHEVHNWSHLGCDEQKAVEQHFLCPQCGRTFSLKWKLYYHIIRVHRPNSAEQAQKVRKRVINDSNTNTEPPQKRLKRGINDSSTDKRPTGYKHCSACQIGDRGIGGYGYSSNGTTFQGQQIPFACDLHVDRLCTVCGRRSKDKNDHTRHCWSHLGREQKEASEHPYLCPHCARKFPFEFYLNSHIRKTHGPYAAIAAAAQLKRKPKVKSTGRAGLRYKCPKCEDTFSAENNMKTHLKGHDVYEGRTFPCTACLEVFVLPHQLAKHKLQCEGFASVRPHKCATCESRYQTRKQLKRHVAAVHLGKKTKKKKYVPVADPSRRRGRWRVGVEVEQGV